MSTVLTLIFAAALLQNAPAMPEVHCGGEAGVRASYDTWMRAYRRHDLPATMAIFSRTVRFSFQGSPDANWRDLRTSYASEFAAKNAAQWIPSYESVSAGGNVGVMLGRWRLVENGRDTIRNRGVDVLNCENGAWRIVRSLNYTEWTAVSISATPRPHATTRRATPETSRR